MMNPNDNNEYNPADDDNQGVVQLLAQGELAGGGVAQADYMDPITNQGPEPIKEEVNDAGEGLSDSEANGVNDDLLAEEDVENGDVTVDNDLES